MFSVADGYLIACFDKDVTEETVKAIAQKQPVYAVFRDSSMASDSVAQTLSRSLKPIVRERKGRYCNGWDEIQIYYTPYQTEAVDSVVGVFASQPFNDHFTYRRDVEIRRDVTNWMLSDEELYMGFANAKVQLDSGQLLENIRRIQTRNNIKLSDSLKSGGLGVCSLDVEMETGTGKTYVYIKTIFELNKQYGWSKFIVVVPSIAIREGVKKKFWNDERSFSGMLRKTSTPICLWLQELDKIDQFSQAQILMSWSSIFRHSMPVVKMQDVSVQNWMISEAAGQST